MKWTIDWGPVFPRDLRTIPSVEAAAELCRAILIFAETSRGPGTLVEAGKYACEQMQQVCIGRIPALDGAVLFAIASQEAANAAMKTVLDKQPAMGSPENASDVLEEARDIVIRLGAYLASIKGHPISPRAFFRNETPSDVARKRLVKLAAAVAFIAEEIPKHPAITDPTWAIDFKAVSLKLDALRDAQQASKLKKVDLGPEVAAQREKWLAVYNANKLVIRGVLAHAAKPELMPLIFDDLAEVHRAPGVSDDAPPSPEPVASPA